LKSLRDKAEENQVLGDALEATRRALAKSEREGAKLKEGLNTVLAGGDKDDKMTLIESLFEKLDGMATRYSSVISTPTIQIPQSPQAGDVGEMSALRRELDDMSNELQRASASSGDSDKLRKQLKAAQDAKIAALADAEAFQTERDDAIAEVERLRQALKTTSAGGGGEPFLNNERMRELEGLLVEAQNAIGLLSDDNESLLVKLRRYEEAGSGSDGSDSKHRQSGAASCQRRGNGGERSRARSRASHLGGVFSQWFQRRVATRAGYATRTRSTKGR
jgi:hypothetical protein